LTTTLLAIDDSKTMRRVLEITFAGENYRTVLAESSDDALAKLRAERPQVALIDHSIAGQSGYELCQQIKREAPTVGVIILSSKQIPYDKARGASVGADDFIDKPFDTQQLIDKVGAVLRRAAEAPRAAPAPAAQPQPVAAQAAAGRPRAETLTFGGGGAAAAPSAQSPTRPAVVSGQRTPTMVTGTAPPQVAPSPPAPPVAAARQVSRAAEPVAIAPTPVTGVRMPAKEPAAAAIPAAAALATAGDGQLAAKLSGLGLSQDQVHAVLSLSREVVEKVVWEVVPVLAETLIREEIKRLTSD
jgi:CheY-like chemotaxis protein